MVLFDKKGSEDQSLLKKASVSVKTEIQALEEILVWFERTAQPFLPQKTLWECKLALAEGFTNTVQYAHQDLSPSVLITVEINFYVDLMEMKIWNMGPKFDLKRKLAELNQSQVSSLEKESDRGLFFMQELTDELEYIRIEDRRNCLIMRKNISL